MVPLVPLCLKWLRETVARLVAWLVFPSAIRVRLNGKDFYLYPATWTMLPAVAGGAPDGDDDDDDADDDDDKSGDDDDDDDADDDDDKSGDDDDAATWKRHARKHERRAKKAEQRAREAEKRITKLESKNKSERDQAIEKAKTEGRDEALKEARVERRAAGLEVAIARAATKGIKVDAEEDGKNVEKTVKFADSDIVQALIEKQIANGELDEDDIFDENGRVKRDGLTEALEELYEDKPHLAAGANGSDDDDSSSGKKRKPKGGSDAGKGSGSGKGSEEKSAEDWDKELRKDS